MRHKTLIASFILFASSSGQLFGAADDIRVLEATERGDRAAVRSLVAAKADVNATLSTAWGGRYVNDFIDRGRVKRVYVQGDAPYRSEPADLDKWFVRGQNGQMVPFSSFATTSWSQGPNSATMESSPRSIMPRDDGT